MLELMARGGMRVGEVLKLQAADVDDQKLTIRNPKTERAQKASWFRGPSMPPNSEKSILFM
jgi:integrase